MIKRFICPWCRLLSVPSGEQASGTRWNCSGLDHLVRRCFVIKWEGKGSTRNGDTGNEDGTLLDKYAMFRFVVTNGLGIDSDKFITRCRVHKFEDMGPNKNLRLVLTQENLNWIDSGFLPLPSNLCNISNSILTTRGCHIDIQTSQNKLQSI